MLELKGEDIIPTEDQIRELAYSMWEQEGRPNGKDWEHYYTAKRILKEPEATAPSTSDQQPGSPLLAQPSGPRSRRFGKKR